MPLIHKLVFREEDLEPAQLIPADGRIVPTEVSGDLCFGPSECPAFRPQSLTDGLQLGSWVVPEPPDYSRPGGRPRPGAVSFPEAVGVQRNAEL
ncbi:MAG TPA: hypothetical protein VH985_08085 [Candidatus Binatia bacterium]